MPFAGSNNNFLWSSTKTHPKKKKQQDQILPPHQRLSPHWMHLFQVHLSCSKTWPHFKDLICFDFYVYRLNDSSSDKKIITINHSQFRAYKAINVETIFDTSYSCNIFIFLSHDHLDWCLTICLRNSQVPRNIGWRHDRKTLLYLLWWRSILGKTH